jgi:hypothetical protein
MLANPLPAPRFVAINITKRDRLEDRGKGIVMGEGLGPTHFNWRPDVEWYIYNRVLPHITGVFGFQATEPNTYVNHPTGWWLDDRSVDFWSEFGRGDPIHPSVGHEIVNFVWNDPNPPWIRWYIWQGWIYVIPWDWIGSGNYISYPYEDLSDQHFDHVHVTFW